MFVKFWQPKTVKTRLAAGVGDEAACEIYRVFVFHLLHRHLDSCDSRKLAFSPPERESDFRLAIPEAWGLTPQATGDLGDRMRSFFESQFSPACGADQHTDPSATKVIVIGSDCPQLDADVIERALMALDDVNVIVGPSTDGGYYLIGMRERCFDVFSNIAWSTPDVLSQTIEQMTQRRISYALLDPLTDIDDGDDLEQLENNLSRGTLDLLDTQLLARIKATTKSITQKEPES